MARGRELGSAKPLDPREALVAKVREWYGNPARCVASRLALVELDAGSPEEITDFLARLGVFSR